MSVQRVADANQPGIRYWRPALFLVLQKTVTEKSQSCEVKTLTLPDKSEEYAINFSPGIGVADVAPTLHDGWRLDSMSARLDSKTAENLSAIAGLLKAAAPGGIPLMSGKRVGPQQDQCSGVFKVVYDPTGELIELREVELKRSHLR